MVETNQRKAYGKTLVKLCRENKDIIVLDADLGGSTMGKMVQTDNPKQHLEMGIAEANMASVAGGLAFLLLIHLRFLLQAVLMTRYAKVLPSVT